MSIHGIPALSKLDVHELLGGSGDAGMEAHIGMGHDVDSAAIAAGRADGFKRAGGSAAAYF